MIQIPAAMTQYLTYCFLFSAYLKDITFPFPTIFLALKKNLDYGRFLGLKSVRTKLEYKCYLNI